MDGTLKGNLHIAGTGDPTLGSWRWERSKDEHIIQQWVAAIKRAGIRKVTGLIIRDDINWATSTIPDGWIWQDIGNYYGAGASSLNWRENQYDLKLRSGNNHGDTCTIVSVNPPSVKLKLVSEVRTAAKGTGDNAFIYLPPYSSFGYIRGTIPLGEKAFTISGSMPDPFLVLSSSLTTSLNNSGVEISSQDLQVSMPSVFMVKELNAVSSSTLDSINYWFLKKSINLYGEALLKTMAQQKEGFASTEKGVDVVKSFWSTRGIEKSALNIMDGSGLSPQNRVTTGALVTAMLYARSKPWFSSFYRSLPEINGIAMKSGSIQGARSYTGYISSKSGAEYTFAIIVNNYDGSSSELVRKIWKTLDVME
jgi:D-alanyl-D-alanine carboxypeptidase/D-alanyl-D-alanine-endopeptidase (penicillin-binding protein 4)